MVPAALPSMATRAAGPAEQRRRGEEHVPLAAGEHRVGAPDGVDGVALVQVEAAALAAVLHHLDELVARLLLVEQPRLRLDHGRRQRQQGGEDGGDDEPGGEPRRPSSGTAARAMISAAPMQRALRADERDGDERRHEGADEAAGRGEREDPPGYAAGVLDAGRRQPDGERRHHAEQHDRRREEGERRGERADHGARARACRCP